MAKSMWLVGEKDEALCSPTPWEWNGYVELRMSANGRVTAQGLDFGNGPRVYPLYGKPNCVKAGDTLILQAPRNAQMAA